LARQGVKELNLVAQDTTAYGTDLVPPFPLANFLKELAGIESLHWIRLLYLRPERITQPLLNLMSGEKKICPYLDIPIQHASDPVLRRMNRPYGQKRLRNLIAEIRRTLPRAVLRTTVMVGFPGEEEREFQELFDFLREVEFDHLGVFRYSAEEGTVAADFTDRIPEEIAQARFELLMEGQKEISLRKNRKRIATVEPVLVTGLSPESDLLIQGRARFQAPEVDGVIYITKGRARFGEIQPVQIIEAHPYDLVGVIVEGFDGLDQIGPQGKDSSF
jgi:ribosomal protein S12 methylthiotransferase